MTGSSETLSNLSSSLRSPGVVPSSGNLKVPLVGVHGNGEPDVGDDRDIDASIPDARQSSAIRACAACRAPSSFEIRAFRSAVLSITSWHKREGAYQDLQSRYCSFYEFHSHFH